MHFNIIPYVWILIAFVGSILKKRKKRASPSGRSPRREKGF